MGLRKSKKNSKSSSDVDSKSFIEKVRAIQQKFYFDAHHTAERRGLLFIVACLLFLGSAGWGTYGAHVKKVLEQNAITGFNAQVTFSKSGENAVVSKFIRSGDGKTVYIPISVDTLNNLSINANNYRIYFLPVSGKLSYKPTGKLIVYNDGNMFIKVSVGSHFNSDHVRVILRNDKNIIDTTAADDDDDTISSSVQDSDNPMSVLESKYDMISFVTNLGTSSVKNDKDVTSETSTDDLYRQLWVTPEINKIKEDTETAKSKLPALYARADEYTKRLESWGFSVPALPKVLSKEYTSYTESTSYDVPSQIYTKDKHQSAEHVSNVGSYSGAGTTDETPATAWQTLLTTWQSIASVKTEIYDTNVQKINGLNKNMELQKDGKSEGVSKRFIVLN